MVPMPKSLTRPSRPHDTDSCVASGVKPRNGDVSRPLRPTALFGGATVAFFSAAS